MISLEETATFLWHNLGIRPGPYLSRVLGCLIQLSRVLLRMDQARDRGDWQQAQVDLDQLLPAYDGPYYWIVYYWLKNAGVLEDTHTGVCPQLTAGGRQFAQALGTHSPEQLAEAFLALHREQVAREQGLSSLADPPKENP